MQLTLRTRHAWLLLLFIYVTQQIQRLDGNMYNDGVSFLRGITSSQIHHLDRVSKALWYLIGLYTVTGLLDSPNTLCNSTSKS